MTRWWRAYNNSIDNAKLLKLSDAMHRAWYTLQCVASENGGTLPPSDDIAARLRLKPAKVAEWITKLVHARLIDNDAGVFSPHNWNSRQYKSDVTDPTAAERNKRYRDKKRNDRNAAVTVIRPEADTEADTEQSRTDASAPVDVDLKKREAGLRAGISAHFASRDQKTPENMDRCLLWLTQGYAAGTILSAVETVLKRGRIISTLDYFDGAIKDAHTRAAPENLQIVFPGEFVIEGTLEWNCWDRHLRETTGRGSPVTDSRDGEGRLRRGWYRSTKVPDGYDEATGERIAPKENEDAA